MALAKVAQPFPTERKDSKLSPIFSKFPIYDGEVPAGYFANFLGVMTKKEFWTDSRAETEEGYHRGYPHLDEMYLEWIDLLQAVDRAETHFTMVELGAGWGRWIANAAAALRYSKRLPYTLVAVEAEPTHFSWMREHLQHNGVDLSQCQLIQAAVTAKDGSVGFHVGSDPTWGGPEKWYGQSIGGSTEVQAISLTTILAPLRAVDLLDLDIQGAEFEVLSAAAKSLTQKVKRVHIETHNREVEKGLRELFQKLGWKNIFDFPCSLQGYPNAVECETEFGSIGFIGGRQSWINPRFADVSEVASLTDKRIVTSLGFDFMADPADYVSTRLIKDRIYEIAETDVITRLVRPGDICVDGGCHIGYFSCLMGRLSGPQSQVYAFDANPLQCQRSRRNSEINGLQNVEVIHAALGDQASGTTIFNVSTDDQTGLSSLGQIESYAKTITVPWLRLEDFLQKKGVECVRMMKLDVEGAEELVLRGLGKFLTAQKVDFFLIECNDERLRLMDSSSQRLEALLTTSGYSCWTFNNGDQPTWREVEGINSRTDVNYLFARPGCEDEVPRLSSVQCLLDLKRTQVDHETDRVSRKTSQSIVTPAEAFWRQREFLNSRQEEIRALSAAIGRPTDLTLAQWAQIAAFAAEFRPDLVLELGRGWGNSTTCFTQVAHHLGGQNACHVLSLCLSDTWRKQTVPRIRKVVPPEWFAPLETLECDILRFDVASRLDNAQRILVFWDAHGFELAEWVLGIVAPKIAFKPHLFIMHDLADLRYCDPERTYGDNRLWRGTSAGDESMWLGHIYSRVAQSISMFDFSTRNKLPVRSGDESFFAEIGGDPKRMGALRSTLGEDLFQLNSHWYWFTLADAEAALTFPKYEPPAPPVSEENKELKALQEKVNSITESRGWKTLNQIYAARDAVAPPGSLRRKTYEWIFTPRKSTSIS